MLFAPSEYSVYSPPPLAASPFERGALHHWKCSDIGWMVPIREEESLLRAAGWAVGLLPSLGSHGLLVSVPSIGL